MANTAITPFVLLDSAGVDVKTRTAIVHANTFSVDMANIKSHKMIFHVLNTTNATKDVTFDAGFAAQSSLGELVVTVGADTGEQIIFLNSSRFVGVDQKITGSVTAGMTGFFACYILP
jgi:hypothetical protein